MKDMQEKKIVFVCCSVLKSEIKLLWRENWPGYRIRFLNSMLHMTPEILAVSLGSTVEKELSKGNKVIIIYGDCCHQISALENKPGVVRTHGNNCCDLLLGHKEYRRLSHEGAYFMMPEWTRRWKEIFMKHLNLNPKNLRSFMNYMHNKLIYLDTGAAEMPEKKILECAKYCGLSYEIKHVSLTHLKDAVEEALLRLEREEVSNDKAK